MRPDVSFFEAKFLDYNGAMKGRLFPASCLKSVLSNGFYFDGSSVGFRDINDSDMRAVPDPGTQRRLPWEEDNTEIYLCDVYDEGGPLRDHPRTLLKKALEDAAPVGSLHVGAEPEFYLLDRNNRPVDEAGYMDAQVLETKPFGISLMKALCGMGFHVETSHHEVGPGQYEFAFRHSDALNAADNIILYKYAVKSVAQKSGYRATFMPKPFPGLAGSGMHLHLSLFRGQENLFCDGATRDSFMAGLLTHISEISLLLNPTVNSYKRLVPGHEAPVYVCWGNANRSALIRIPRGAADASSRIELRSADPSCNPYLAFTAILAAGLDGIKRQLAPPQARAENIYCLGQEDLARDGISTLPSSLGEAIEEFRKSAFAESALGKSFFWRYLSLKEREWAEYRAVQEAGSEPDWELRRYLDV